MGRHLAMSPRKSSLAVLAKALFRTFMEHLFLELFKLRYAADHGGKVLYLADFATSGLSLRSYIDRFYQQI
jgi:hypothetical protein